MPMPSKAAISLVKELPDIAPDKIFARLHPLNGRKRQTRKLRQLALIQAGERARRLKLSRCYHVRTISYSLQKYHL